MSTFQNKRCVNCGVRYTYQASGYGGLQPNNDPTYCSDCYQVIQVALATVPPRSVPDWVGTSDVTTEDLLAQEAAHAAEAKAKGAIPVQRVLAPLFDLTRPDNQHRQGIVSRDGRTYRYEYWTQQGGPAAGRVYVEVERDTQTGEIVGPWKLQNHWTSMPTFIEHPPWPDPPPPTHEFVPMPFARPRRFPLLELESESIQNVEPLVKSRDYTDK